MSSYRGSPNRPCLRLTPGVLLAVAFSGGVAGAAKPSTRPSSVEPAESEAADTPREAAEWRYAQRAYPLADVPGGAYLAAHRSWQAMIERATSPLSTLSSAEGNTSQLGPVVGPAWTLLRPAPVGTGANTRAGVNTAGV